MILQYNVVQYHTKQPRYLKKSRNVCKNCRGRRGFQLYGPVDQVDTVAKPPEPSSHPPCTVTQLTQADQLTTRHLTQTRRGIFAGIFKQPVATLLKHYIM